jgi:hypothetical protein
MGQSSGQASSSGTQAHSNSIHCNFSGSSSNSPFPTGSAAHFVLSGHLFLSSHSHLKYCCSWAKYPLIALLILALLVAALDVPNLPDLGSLTRFVLGLLYAAANKVAYDELKRATNIDPPLL